VRWYWVLLIALVLVIVISIPTKILPRVIDKVLNLTQAQRLNNLQPKVKIALENTLKELRASGIDCFIGSTLRSNATQAAKVASGNSATKQSWHLGFPSDGKARAVDLYPLLPNGKPDLNGTQIEKFRMMHKVAAKHGFRGLAFNPDGSKRYINTSKGKIWDGGHIEFPEGLTFAQAMSKGKVV
jgi:hypothetical protein